MKELLTLSADPKALTPDATGAVLLATNSRNLNAVKMVVELGLDVNLHFNAKDNFGRTPLEEAEFEATAPTIELMELTAAKAAK